MKKTDNTGYLWHHGTGPFWLFSWEILQKNERTRVICSIAVPSRFDDLPRK